MGSRAARASVGRPLQWGKTRWIVDITSGKTHMEGARSAMRRRSVRRSCYTEKAMPQRARREQGEARRKRTARPWGNGDRRC